MEREKGYIHRKGKDIQFLGQSCILFIPVSLYIAFSDVLPLFIFGGGDGRIMLFWEFKPLFHFASAGKCSSKSNVRLADIGEKKSNLDLGQNRRFQNN